MFKFYSILIGENPKYTATFQPASKRKVALYANCLIVPVILWFINGYLLVTNVLEGSMTTAIMTAFIAAFIIFLIERAILMSNGSPQIFWFRILLGLIVAFLGSISLDEVIFKGDIDNQVESYKQAFVDDALNKVERDYKDRIIIQEALVTKKYAEWIHRVDLADREASGDSKSGTGNKGYKDVAKFKERLAANQETDYRKETTKLSSLNTNFEIAKDNAKKKAQGEFKGNALLIRIRAMVDLIGKDYYMMWVYILFTSFLFCLEFLVVLIKIYSKSSIDEDLEKAREKLMRAKTQKTLDRSSIFFNPEEMVPSVQNANVIMQSKPSSIFN